MILYDFCCNTGRLRRRLACPHFFSNWHHGRQQSWCSAALVARPSRPKPIDGRCDVCKVRQSWSCNASGSWTLPPFGKTEGTTTRNLKKIKQIRNPATHILFFFDRTLSCNYLSYVLQISSGISRNVSRLSLNDSRFTIHKFCVTDMHDPYVNQV